MTLPNVQHQVDTAKTVIATNDYYAGITYYKTIDDFIDYQDYSKYITEIEKLIRTSSDYKKFVSYVKNVLGLNSCQVFSDLRDVEQVTIEIHHGPLFTLYDICEVVLQWFLKNDQPVNTFRVAKKVLEEHFNLRVGVVALSTTGHEMVHNNDVILSVNQSLGDTDAFIKYYTPYLTDEQKYKLWTYVNMCKTNPSFDRGILDVDHIIKYIKN